jgi:sialic acid synthase SpsE
MMRIFTVGDREIGEDHPAFIIAEAGSNHNGSLDQAKKLIDVAVTAGASAVKFQIFSADTLYSRFTPGFTYLKRKDIHAFIREIETPRVWIPELADYCAKHSIQFLASPFDFEAIDLLEPYVRAYKIASFEIGDLELLRYAAGKGKPLILSTGMANLGDVEDALDAIRSEGNDEIVLLHCNSLYPAPVEIVNLKALETMRRVFRCPVGFSDHTLGIHIPLAAVAMGAVVIEKHFTLSRTMEGPDHGFSLEPGELAEMIRQIRDVERAKGTGIKECSSAECEEMYEKARRSIHARKEILPGTPITRDMLVVKRPGYGIAPKFIDLVIGRRARRIIREDEWIDWEMV